MARRIDWEQGEALYRAGQVSIRVIAETLGCSEAAVRKQAKGNGWERDLTGKVAASINAELARDASGGKLDEREIVSAAAKLGADVVRTHRRRIRSLTEISEKLEARLLSALDDAQPADDVPPDAKQLELLGKMYGHCARATASLIPLERQAFNLDPRGAEKLPEEDRDRVTFKMYLGGKPAKSGGGNE